MGRPPKKTPVRKGTSVRLSARDEWFIAALIEQGYGESATEVLRRGLWDLVRKVQNEGRLPRLPTRALADIPPPDSDDPPEAA